MLYLKVKNVSSNSVLEECSALWILSSIWAVNVVAKRGKGFLGCMRRKVSVEVKYKQWWQDH